MTGNLLPKLCSGGWRTDVPQTDLEQIQSVRDDKVRAN